MPQAQNQEAALGTSFTFRPAISERARQAPARTTKDLLNHLYTLPVAHIRQKKLEEIAKQQQENGELLTETSGEVITVDEEGNVIEQEHQQQDSTADSAASPTGGEAVHPRKTKKISTREFEHIYKTLLSYRELADMKRKEKAQELMARQGLQEVPTIDQHSRALAAGRYRNTGGNVWSELYARAQQVPEQASPQSARSRSPQPPTGIPRRARTPQPRYHDQLAEAAAQLHTEYTNEVPTIQIENNYHTQEQQQGFDPSISPAHNPSPPPPLAVQQPAPQPKAAPLPPPVKTVPKPIPTPVAPAAEDEQGVVLGSVPSRLLFTVPKRTNSVAASSNAARSAPKPATRAPPSAPNTTAARQRIAAESIALQQRQGYNPAAQVPFMGHFQGNGLPAGFAQAQGWGQQPQGYGAYGQPAHGFGGGQQFYGTAPGMAAMAYRGMAW